MHLNIPNNTQDNNSVNDLNRNPADKNNEDLTSLHIMDDKMLFNLNNSQMSKQLKKNNKGGDTDGYSISPSNRERMQATFKLDSVINES